MNTLLKTAGVAAIAVTMMATGASAVSADDHTDNELKAKIMEMRAAHADLKAQVEAGEITQEEARETWKGMVEEIKAEKQAHFEARKAKVEAKYQELLGSDPERAEKLKERMDAAEARRTEHQAKKAEIKAQVESGEITKQQAMEMKKEHMQERKAAVQERKANRAEQKEMRKENKPQRMPAPAPEVEPAQ